MGSDIIKDRLGIRDNGGLICIIGAFTILRLLVAPLFGLGVDEAHYLLYARHLALSYLDHPPLTGWLHFVFINLFGGSELAARLSAILLFALTSFLVYRFILVISDHKKTALLAVLAVNSSFMLNALGIMLLPDSLLLVLVFLFLNIIIKIEGQGQWRQYILLGIILGLAGLAKYTAILFLLPMFIYLLIKKRYDLFLSGKMVIAGIIACGLVAPVIYWNYLHDFASFRFQGTRVFAYESIDIMRFLTALAAQFGAYSPFLFLISFYGFFRSLLSKNNYLILSALMGGTVMAFFFYSSFYETALPHWSSIFYILFIPIGVYFLASSASRPKRYFLNFSLIFSLIVTLFLYILLATKFISFPDYQSPFRDIYGYDLIAAKADAILKTNQKEKKALAVTEWTMASRVKYYSLEYDNKLFVIDDRKDQYDLWQAQSPEGYDMLFIHSRFSDPFINPGCELIEKAGEMDLIIRGGKVDTISFFWCYNFQKKD